MSDDTKALIDRLRDHENEGVTGSDRFHLRNEAADTVERLQRDRDALAECCEKLREALNQIAVLAEWQTSGPDASPRCKSDALSAGHATSLRGSISEIARSALAAPKDAP